MLDLCCWVLPICRDLEIFMMMYNDLMTCITWRCMTSIRCDRWGILYMHVVWIWCEDVASISWIFILFACIITLIEIGRYIRLPCFSSCYCSSHCSRFSYSSFSSLPSSSSCSSSSSSCSSSSSSSARFVKSKFDSWFDYS